MKKTLKSILVLSLIAVISGGILAVANRLWGVKIDALAALKSVYAAESYTKIYGADSQVIKDFNGGAGGGYISNVYKASGGGSGDAYIIESVGEGFNRSIISILLAYNTDGLIIGYATYSYDSAVNNFFASVSQKKLANTVSGLSFLDTVSGETLCYQTGATAVYSLGGVANAINLSNRFFLQVIKEESLPDYSTVTDTDLLRRLSKLHSDLPEATGEYIRLNYAVTSSEYYGGATASIFAAYFLPGEYGRIVIETVSESGSFGGWTTLVMVDTAEKRVLAIDPISGKYNDYGGEYAGSALNDADVLTNIFASLSAAEIANLQKYLVGISGIQTTGATQSNNGIKAAVLCALDGIDDVVAFRDRVINQINQLNQTNGGEGKNG